MPLPPNSAVVFAQSKQGSFPALELPGGRKLDTPSQDWIDQQLRWRWLLDSWEGGEKYRQAVYGLDLHGMPVRNLIRHKREYPLPQDSGTYSPYVGRPTGTDQAAQAGDDDYELRRARTPIPTFLPEAIGEHLSKIYNQEIRRKAPKPIEGWWEDVDGLGSTVDQWFADVAAPLLMVFGMLDFKVENTPAPSGEEVRTRADELRLGLDKVVVDYVLPMNIPWAKVDRRDRYVEILVREVDDDGLPQWRYWDAKSWTLFDNEGELVETRPHGYGRVPIVRCYDKRRPSSPRVGLPRYEAIAELQREYYNRDSELILSDTTQAHPLLQGPEDYVKADGEISIGPGYVLPKKKNSSTDTYEGWDYVDPPKGAADSLRQNKTDLRDAADRAACLTKPAGAAGTTGQTVAQSGVSKRLDQSTGNELLGKIAKTLQKAEESVASLAAEILGVKITPGSEGSEIEVQYPGQFDLYDADELMMGAQSFQLILSQAGDAPETEGTLLSKIVRLLMPGMDDESYAEMDAEIEECLERKAQDKTQQRESMLAAAKLAADPDAADESTEGPAGLPAPAQPTEGD